MGDVINLRRFRKRAEKQRDEKRAAANRALHGRTKAHAHWKKRRLKNFAGISMRTKSKKENAMKSPVVKRSIVIAGHKTSVSLEDAFWASLKDIAGTRNMTLSELVASIDADRRQGNLSSAIRLYVLDHFRAQSGSRAAEGRETGARLVSALHAE